MKMFRKNARLISLFSASLLLAACQSAAPAAENVESDSAAVVDELEHEPASAEESAGLSDESPEGEEEADQANSSASNEQEGENNSTDSAGSDSSSSQDQGEDLKIEDYFGSYEDGTEISSLGISLGQGEVTHYFTEVDVVDGKLHYRLLRYPSDPSYAVIQSGQASLSEDGELSLDLGQGETINTQKLSDQTSQTDSSNFHPDLYSAEKKVAQLPGSDALVAVIDYQAPVVVSSAEDAQAYLEESAQLNAEDLGQTTIDQQTEEGGIPFYFISAENGSTYVVTAIGNIMLYNNGAYQGLDWALSQ